MRWILAALFLLPLATVSPAAAGDDDVIARMGTVSVSLADMQAYLNTLPSPERAALAGDPKLLSQAVRTYLAGRVVLNEARDKKFDQQAEVKTQLERVRDGALAELYLQAVAKTPEGFPSEAELEAAYEANKAAFVAPRLIHLAQIFIAQPMGAKPGAKLEAVIKALTAKGADFAAIARDTTDNPAEAAKGGEIGWLAEPQLQPAIARAVAELGKDKVSAPLRLDDGWHIVKVLEVKPAGSQPLPLSEVKGALTEQLHRQRSQELRQAYLADLLRQNPPVLNELALSRLAK